VIGPVTRPLPDNTQHSQETDRQTYVPQTGFESAVPANEWPQTYALTLKLPTTTIVAQPFNVIKWQLKFNPVA